MARRNIEALEGVRYLGNNNTTTVHDLDQEKTNCMIDNFIQEGHAIPFNSLEEAHDAGMQDCPYCLEG